MRALGFKTTRVFQAAAEVADREGRGFEPVIFFLCALDFVDPDYALVPLTARDAALRRVLTASAHEASGTQTKFERFIAAAFDEAALRGHPVVYPVDVLRASLHVAEDAIGDAFAENDVRRAFRLDKIEDMIPAVVLRDEPVEPAETGDSAASTRAAAFAVVITGPDFSDRSNRYATLAEAQQAADTLSVRAFGSPIFPASKRDEIPRTISISVPRRLNEATRIEIEEC